MNYLYPSDFILCSYVVLLYLRFGFLLIVEGHTVSYNYLHPLDLKFGGNCLVGNLTTLHNTW